MNFINKDVSNLNNYYNKDETDAKIQDIELFKFPNATIYGQPTIQNGQISNFSNTNYLKFPFLVDFQGRPFEINFEFTTGNDLTNQQNIIDSDFGLAFALRNARFVIAISTNGTTWDLGEGVGTHPIQTNTTYKVKITWDGTAYNVSYSTNGGESYITDITITSNLGPYPKQIYIGVGENNGIIFNHFEGIINFNYCNLIISDKLVWQGMDDVGLATRLAVDMSNIDSIGEQKIKDVASEIIPTKTSELTNDSDYTTKTYVDNNKVSKEEGEELYSHKLLWENPSPTSAFASQTINLPEHNYKFYDIVIRANTTNSRECIYTFRVNRSGQIYLPFYYTPAGKYYLGMTRRIITTTQQAITIANTEYMTTYTTTGSTDNTYSIPVAIYGHN